MFGTRRAQKPVEALPREDVIGSLYPETVSTDTQVVEAISTPPPTPAPMPISDLGPVYNPNESVIDPHARFNGQYASDRDLRVEGEAAGEIDCQGTLVISPAARVRSAVKAHNVVVNGDYEGDVECGGRFEIGSTGRVRGTIRTQILVVHEGAHWDGSVVMSNLNQPKAVPVGGQGAPQQLPRPATAQVGARGGSIFGKGDAQPAEGARSGRP